MTAEVNAETTKAKAPKVDKKLQEMIDAARAAQEQARQMRKQAPDVDLMAPVKDIPQKTLIKQWAEMDGFTKNDEPGGYHYMLGDRDMAAQYPYLGYEPVIDRRPGGTGKQDGYQGDQAWKIPTDLYQAQLEENAKRSRAKLPDVYESEMRKSKAKPGVSDEEIKVAKTGTPEAAELLRQEAGIA